jgi:hypothetical protein
MTPLVAVVVSQAKAQDRGPISREDYLQRVGRPCPCPDNVAKDRSSCGKRSAYCRPGGYEPLCYLEDKTPDQMKVRRLALCGW